MKRLLRANQAAAYCEMGVQTFHANCPVKPLRVHTGQRGLRWDVKDLDSWIDSLKQTRDEQKTPDQWLATLDEDQSKRRQGVREQRQDVRVPSQERKTIAQSLRDRGIFY